MAWHGMAWQNWLGRKGLGGSSEPKRCSCDCVPFRRKGKIMGVVLGKPTPPWLNVVAIDFQLPRLFPFPPSLKCLVVMGLDGDSCLTFMGRRVPGCKQNPRGPTRVRSTCP